MAKYNYICKNCKKPYIAKKRTGETCSQKCCMGLWRKRNRTKNNIYLSNLKKKHKLQVNARNAVYRDRKLRPELYPQECCICGVTENIEYHHPDYNFQLSVYPMCKRHHTQLHRGELKS